MEMILMVISLQVIRRKIGSLPVIQKKLQGLLRIVERSLSPVKRIEDSKFAEGLSPQAYFWSWPVVFFHLSSVFGLAWGRDHLDYMVVFLKDSGAFLY